jgi:beta-N-acetylhexosaminidase
MSIREDIGQLLWIGFPGTRAPSRVLARLARGEIGATILFKENLVLTPAVGSGVAQQVCDLDALEALTAELAIRAPDGTPAWIAVDQEGGLVQRVRAPATQWPPMLAHDGLPEGDDERVAEEVGLALGGELRALGFDVDFAPVLDVHTNPSNPIIGERAFGRDATTVARRALAFARGLERVGMVACGKHFPGHGDTDTDSHLALPKIDHGWDRLERVELEPFRRAAAAGLPMIMTADVVFAALDASVPATSSRAVITGLLRERLGYRGVIVSDDLDMKAIADHFGAGRAAVAAVRAGCDVLLLCHDERNQELAERALIDECGRDGELAARVVESATRIRALKQTHAERVAKLPVLGRDVVGSFAHRRLADRLAGRG